MKGFTICSLTLLASLGSAQINVDSGSERIDVTGGGGGGGDGNTGGDGDVNTRFFTSGNTAIDSFIGAAAGTVVANVAGGLFNGYREKCRFKRQADTKSQTDVDTRLICLDDILPKPVDCNRCQCYQRECRDCYQCRQPDCYQCSCRQRDCSNYCNKCSYNSGGGGGGRPWSSGSSGGSYRPQTSRPSYTTYRPTTYRPPYNTGWRNGGGDDAKSGSSSGGGVSFVNQ